MDSIKIFISAFLFLSLFSYLGAFAAPSKPGRTQIKVTLLGEQCNLEGPLNQAALNAIHSVGPDQIYPALSSPNTGKEKSKLEGAIKKAKEIRDLPPELDRYRTKLIHRLEQQSAFMDAVGEFKKSHSAESLLKTGKENLAENQFETYKTLVKKLELAHKSPAQEREIIDQLFDSYNEGIGPDPESEFHRAIKSLNVQYHCAFE